MTNKDVVGYYERSKLWNEKSPVPHTLAMQLLANYALTLDKIARVDHLRLAEVGALPGREATAVLGGMIHYHVEDENAGEGVLFHDILSGPLPNKYGVLVAGLVLQEFQTEDEVITAVDHMYESADILVISYFDRLLDGAWDEWGLPPSMPVHPWKLMDALSAHGELVSECNVMWDVSGTHLLDEYAEHARNELILDEKLSYSNQITHEIWVKNND